MLNLKKVKSALYAEFVFPASDKIQLKCGFIPRKKGFALVAGKRIVNGGIIRNSLDNKWNIRDLFLNIGLAVEYSVRYGLQSWVGNLL